MEVLLSVLAGLCVALLFSLAIFIHEFGHFLAARWLGLQVDAFAVGFGPALWKRTVNGVEYKLGCVPFGGYVALPQLDPSGMEKVQGEQHGKDAQARCLPDIATWKRIVVAVAGPFGNVVLAVALAYLIFFMPGVKTGVVNNRVGWVAEDSEAWKAGLRPGDWIQKVNGQKISNWTDLQVEFQLAGESGHATFEVLQQDMVTRPLELTFQTNNVFDLRILSGVYPASVCVVSAITSNSAAAQSGLKVGDEIQSLSNITVQGALHFSWLIKRHNGVPEVLGVKRGAERLLVPVTPRYDVAAQRYLIGIMPGDAAEHVKPWMMYREPWRQLKWDSMSVVRVLQALILPESKGERAAVAKNIGGPVAIVMGLYNTVRGGMMDGLGFLRMICVNLAILNLLPLPVLDGGHILFALFEMITRRKPHPKVVSVLVNACAVLLIGLMALLFYRDIVKNVKISRALSALEREEAAAFAAQTAVTNAPAKP